MLLTNVFRNVLGYIQRNDVSIHTAIIAEHAYATNVSLTGIYLSFVGITVASLQQQRTKTSGRSNYGYCAGNLNIWIFSITFCYLILTRPDHCILVSIYVNGIYE